eukprot:2949520-Pleurochrysis_carterae.AAC.2
MQLSITQSMQFATMHASPKIERYVCTCGFTWLVTTHAAHARQGATKTVEVLGSIRQCTHATNLGRSDSPYIWAIEP